MKSVAIVGFASSSRGLAPFNDDAVEIWTMNHAPISWIPKWNVLFENHTLDHLRRVAAHGEEPTKYLDWLKAQPGPDDPKFCPIYMQDHYDHIPASVKLPHAWLNAWFAERGGNTEGYFAKDYWTSSISYMIGLAIMQGRPEIGIYGVDLLQDEEYVYQRSGAEYLIGFARGMGIKVYIPTQSALCKANYTYGYSEPAVGMGVEKSEIKPLIDYIEDKAKLCESLVARARQDSATFHGAKQLADLVIGWIEKPEEGKDLMTSVKDKAADLEMKFKNAHESIFQLAGQAEAFKTAVVWSKHFARGGALES